MKRTACLLVTTMSLSLGADAWAAHMHLARRGRTDTGTAVVSTTAVATPPAATTSAIADPAAAVTAAGPTAVPATPPATNPNGSTVADDDTATTAAAEQARVAFQQGVADYNDGRFADALLKFQESLRLRRNASAAMNMGITLRAMGRLIEARASFREFFELSSERQRTQFDAQIREYLKDISDRIGTVHVNSASPAAYVLRIDERTSMVDAQGNFDVDPGSHQLYIEAEGYIPQRMPIQMVLHGRQAIDIKLERLAGSSVVGPGNPSGSGATSGGSSAGIIAGVVIGVLVVGAGAGVLGWYLSTPADPPPTNTGLTVDVSGR